MNVFIVSVLFIVVALYWFFAINRGVSDLLKLPKAPDSLGFWQLLILALVITIIFFLIARWLTGSTVAEVQKNIANTVGVDVNNLTARAKAGLNNLVGQAQDLGQRFGQGVGGLGQANQGATF